jgi:hypothetical protein
MWMVTVWISLMQPNGLIGRIGDTYGQLFLASGRKRFFFADPGLISSSPAREPLFQYK